MWGREFGGLGWPFRVPRCTAWAPAAPSGVHAVAYVTLQVQQMQMCPTRSYDQAILQVAHMAFIPRLGLMRRVEPERFVCTLLGSQGPGHGGLAAQGL